MKLNKYLSGIAASAIALSCATAASANITQVNPGSPLKSNAVKQSPAVSGLYIIEMKGVPAITKATQVGELIPSNQLVAIGGNNYNADTPLMRRYVETMKQRQAAVARDIGVDKVLHNYAHTFNGFSARLSKAQAEAMRNHPDVVAVYADEVHQLQTANTPAFLGLTGPGGQHTLGIKGEDVVVGIIDSGISPEHPSFADNPEVPEMSYGPAPAGWSGACNEGSIGEFVADGVVVYNDDTVAEDVVTCNDKLIGARYFGSTFSSVYEIQFGLGEFASVRDADGHGSHTASTAAGNAGVTAVLQDTEVGTVSGIAPRARVAAYKVCWNSGYVSPEGVNERGCFFGDSMAAIDQAVVDGVDVLNYSIGNTQAINSPVYNASLRALEAGVFFSASAGNSGSAAATVSNIAPWIATVAASTYDGVSAVIGSELTVNSGILAPSSIFSVPAAIGTAIPEAGLTADLGLAEPLDACTPLSGDLSGQIALIARGGCPFVDKLLNAEAAGAIGAVVFTQSGTPIPMGGTDPGIAIPGVMVFNSDGLSLLESVTESTTNVTMSTNGVATEAVEVGNIIAGFSSRGVNTQSNDILKPDITAPGVRILAATSPAQLDIPGNVDGEDFAYLQGTSMSSPHIAGMAALLMGQHPEWTPAQVKSAMMTSARQDLVKEDGSTPADPFDFGAGHVDPIPAMNPGLVYSANFADYLGFLCGQGEADLVASLSDTTCTALETSGFATEASQLNYPSISVGNLVGSETISRTLTDVSGAGGSYTVSIDAPTGIDVQVATFDAMGVETDSDLLVVDANGTASYSLTFTTTESFIPDTWVFGAITLTGADGTVVRSPIAVFADALVAPATIEVPEFLSLELNRGRTSTFVRTLYSGTISLEHSGLVGAGGMPGSASDLGPTFDFNTKAQAGEFFAFLVPDGTSLLRIALTDGLVGTPGANLDLHLWECVGGSCNPVQSSENADSNEDMIVVNPEPRADGASATFYVLMAHAADTAGATTVDYTALAWLANGAEATTRVSTSRRAVANRFQNVSIRTRGLNPDQLYMGTITYTDGDGVEQGTTVIQVQP